MGGVGQKEGVAGTARQETRPLLLSFDTISCPVAEHSGMVISTLKPFNFVIGRVEVPFFPSLPFSLPRQYLQPEDGHYLLAGRLFPLPGKMPLRSVSRSEYQLGKSFSHCTFGLDDDAEHRGTAQRSFLSSATEKKQARTLLLTPLPRSN